MRGRFAVSKFAEPYFSKRFLKDTPLDARLEPEFHSLSDRLEGSTLGTRLGV